MNGFPKGLAPSRALAFVEYTHDMPQVEMIPHRILVRQTKCLQTELPLCTVEQTSTHFTSRRVSLSLANALRDGVQAAIMPSSSWRSKWSRA